jgi:hypothetical protein
LEVPLGAQLLTAELRHGATWGTPAHSGDTALIVWALVEVNEPPNEVRRVYVYQPDKDIPPLQSMTFLARIGTHFFVFVS